MLYYSSIFLREGSLRNRLYSFLIPWFSDGALALVQTAVPLIAIRFGASFMMLGIMGFVAQAVRMPICVTAGHLSEKTGRAAIIVPAAVTVAISSIGLALAHSNYQVIVLYSILLAAIGAFYPPLQALVGDVSKRGQLTKNLSMFNMGWCIGGAVMAIAARWLVPMGLPSTLYVAAAGTFVAAGLVLTWRGKAVDRSSPDEVTATAVPAIEPRNLLLIARMGHVLGFFSFSTVRMVFPKLGIELGWTEARVAGVVALLLWGQAVGMMLASASPWWRGKLWPQVMAQCLMLASGLAVALFSSPVLLGAAFFGVGASQSIAYTAALYHGLSARRSLGRNTGIHESLVAAGNISGSLLGGLAASLIAPRAPYVLIALLASVSLISTAALSTRRESG